MSDKYRKWLVQFVIWYSNLIYELIEITTELKLTYQAEVSAQLRWIFGRKKKSLVTQEIENWQNPKTQTTRRQNWRLYLGSNICRLCGDMTKFGGYSNRIAEIDDEIKEKLNFLICPNSTINLLVSRSDMRNMRCFSIGGMKKPNDAILESFGTTEEIIYSLTRLPSTTYSLRTSSLFDFKNLEFTSSPCSVQSSKLF